MAHPRASPASWHSGPGGTAPLTEEQLEEWKDSEEKRVAAEQEASQATYDSLKAEWDSLVQLDSIDVLGAAGLLYCDPLAYAAAVKIIGPEGGDVSIGPHKLSIPAGALALPVVITGELPVSMAVSVRLLPEGLAFAAQPKLTLSYQHCLNADDSPKRVAYTDELLNPLEFPPSQDWPSEGKVEAWLDHFSRYAVWY